MIMESKHKTTRLKANTGSPSRTGLILLKKRVLGAIAGFVLAMPSLAAAAIIYVSPTGNGNGTSWATAADINNAVNNLSTYGDQLWLKQGTYTPGGLNGAGISLYGGFVGTETSLGQRSQDPTLTVIQSAGFSIVGFSFAESEYDGMTFLKPLVGDAIVGSHGNTTIRNCIFDGTQLDFSSSSGASTAVFNCIIRNTETQAVLIRPGAIGTFVDCEFIGNHTPGGSGNGGGAINVADGQLTVDRCIFRDNSSDTRGGAIQVVDGDSQISNSLFYNNSAALIGGAIYYVASSGPSLRRLQLLNCTFTENSAPNNGSAIEVNAFSDTRFLLRNSIVWGNTGSTELNICPNCGASITLTNNLLADPMFADPGASDYRLATCSPARNAGNNAHASGSEDLDLNPRIVGGTIDLGCYELQTTPADTDADGVPDVCDICAGGNDNADADGDGVPDFCDACPGFDDAIDGDGDSVPDLCDACPGGDDNADADGDGVPDFCDTCPEFDDAIDADGDGVPDLCDTCPGFDDAIDADGDGVPDLCDACPGFDDTLDADNDSVPDGCDSCPNDANKSDPGVCGCGVADVDSDSDGTLDCNDGCPNDIDRIVPGICGCNAAETDSDGDGAPDCIDPCLADPGNTCINPGLTAMFVETFQVLPNASGVELGDVDGDGDLDAFLATFNAPERVLLNDGNGFFVDSGQDLGFSFSDKVRLADLDKDGDVDALVGREAGSGVVAWINNGNGNFVIGQIFGTSAPSGNAVGDIDGDGDQDLLIVGSPQGRFWLNDGTANFTSGSTFSFGSEVSPELGDLDGDGDLDAFIGRNGANKVLFNNGSGIFTNSGQNLGNIQCFEVRLADFDGDGDLDAFESGGNFKPDSFWINDGNGFFTAGQAFGDSHGRGITIGDIDSDGDVDMIHCVLGTGRLFINDGTGMVTNLQALPNMVDAALGDLDGDGDLDAFLVQAGTSTPTTVFKNILNHRNAAFMLAGTTQAGSDSRDVELGDLDGDGDLDAFVANISGQPNTVWLNDGAGGYTDSLQSLGTEGSFGIALGDVNRDGALDAFLANNGVNTVWLGDGGGGFSDSGQALGTATSREVALGDLNGDGHLDAFVADTPANSVWLNDDAAPGQFINTQSVGSGDWQDVVLGDMDSDGDLDAVTVTPTLAQIWYNDATGIFSAGASFAQTNARGLAVGDLDYDGDLDVYVANAGVADEIWLNDGLGGFVFQQALGSTASTAVQLGDVDNDGDLDAVVTDGSAAASKVWLNDGAATFSDSGVATDANVSGQGLALGDIDADGDLDVLTVTCCAQPNHVWLNTGGQFGLPTIDMTPGLIAAGQTAAVLAITASRRESAQAPAKAPPLQAGCYTDVVEVAKRTDLPSSLRVGRMTVTWKELAELPEDLHCRELVLSGTSISSIPCSTRIRDRLDLQDCTALRSLPEGLEVSSLNLRGCLGLEQLPPGLRTNFVDLQGCANLTFLPADLSVTIGRLSVRDCKQIRDVPASIGPLAQLDLAGCSDIEALPPALEVTSALDIGDTKISNMRTLRRPLASAMNWI